MAARIWQNIQGLIHGHKIIAGSFRPAGTGAPTNVTGRGFSVARTSVGLYTLTFTDAYPELASLEVGLRGADGLGHRIEAGDYSAANKTLQLRVFDGAGPRAQVLDIAGLRDIASNAIQNLAAHGGILASDSTPILERVNGATDKALRVKWAASDSNEAQFPPIPMLPGMNGATDITLHLLAKMSGATDTPTIDVQVYDAIGDTEMGGATAALSSSLQELTVTLAAANLSGHPSGFLNVSLVPGTHTTDAIELYAAWLEYTGLVDLSADADNVVNFCAHFRNSSINVTG